MPSLTQFGALPAKWHSDHQQQGSASLRRAILTVPELWVAGIAFAVYPALRPFSAEVSLAGATAFASPRWVVAHAFGMLGFTLLGLGFFRLAETLTTLRTRARKGLTLAWIGVGLTLSYYGAEVFGLHAAGQQALATNNIQQFDQLTHDIRWEAGIWFILLGLSALAAGSIVLTTAAWKQVHRPRLTLLPAAIAITLYIPQFAAAQPIRVAHGLLMTLGCILMAYGMTASRHGEGRSLLSGIAE
jgi:hypothetical protein